MGLSAWTGVRWGFARRRAGRGERYEWRRWRHRFRKRGTGPPPGLPHLTLGPDPIRGGGWRRSRNPVFFPEYSISWQEIMKKYRRRACNSAKYDRMKTEQKIESGFRRPLPPAPAPARKTTDGAGRRGAPCAWARARAQSGARTAPAPTRPPARDCARHSGAPAPGSRAAGKRSEDGSRGETYAGNRKPEKPGGIPGAPDRDDRCRPGPAAPCGPRA